MSSDELQRKDDQLIGQLVAEVRGCREDILEVKSSIKWQNGRVRTLEEWKVGRDSVEKRNDRLLMVLGGGGVIGWITIIWDIVK